MCTLIALHRCSDWPLVIAANRDEHLDRPAETPALRETAAGTVAAPLDLRAGGTWFGVNPAGVFSGITNRPCPEPDPERRSRGHVVIESLAAASAAQAAEACERLEGGAYNPFNLLLADAEQAFVVVYEEAPKVFALRPGAHVIGNADPDTRTNPKVARLLDRAEAVATLSPAHQRDALAEICRGHEGGSNSFQSTCIHAGGYGTRSSTLLRLGPAPEDAEWLYADGPPCETNYRNITPLLGALRSASGQPARTT